MTSLADVAQLTNEDVIMRRLGRLAHQLRQHQHDTERLFTDYLDAQREAEAIGVECHIVLADYLQAALGAFKRAAEGRELQQRARQIVRGEFRLPAAEGEHGWPNRTAAK